MGLKIKKKKDTGYRLVMTRKEKGKDIEEYLLHLGKHSTLEEARIAWTFEYNNLQLLLCTYKVEARFFLDFFSDVNDLARKPEFNHRLLSHIGIDEEFDKASGRIDDIKAGVEKRIAQLEKEGEGLLRKLQIISQTTGRRFHKRLISTVQCYNPNKGTRIFYRAVEDGEKAVHYIQLPAAKKR